MNLMTDESGQGAAEYILLFGGILVISISALLIYRSYYNPGINPFRATSDLSIVRVSVT